MNDDKGSDPSGPLFTSRRTRRRSPIPPIAWVGIPLLAIGAFGAWWFWLRSPDDDSGRLPEVTALSPSDSVTAGPDEPFVPPPLEESDPAVRMLARGVSAHPQLAAWLIPDDLIRRFVEAVVDISRASSPLPALEVLIPEDPFAVMPSGDQLIMDPRSYRRYDLLAEVLSSFDAREAADAYRDLVPLFQEAYQELGVSDGPFEEVLARAVENLLAVEVPGPPLALRVAVGRYVYADETVESLSPAAKHLVRMGPENARRVQEALREISLELGLLPPAEDGTPADTVDHSESQGSGGGEMAGAAMAPATGFPPEKE